MECPTRARKRGGIYNDMQIIDQQMARAIMQLWYLHYV